MIKQTSIIKLIRLWGIVFLTAFTGVIVAVDLVTTYHDFSIQIDNLRTENEEQQKLMTKREVERVVNMINYERTQSELLTRSKIKSRVYEAFAIAQNIYQRNKNDKSDAEIQQIIIDAIRPIRFENGNGYFFVNGLDGVVKLFAERPEMEGLNLLDVQDTRGQYVMKDMIEIAQNSGEGFYEYFWTKPQSRGRDFKKLSFVKKIDHQSWFVGAGLYVDDLDEQIKAKWMKRINNIRFGKNRSGYLFAGDWRGKSLSHGAQPDLIGTNMWNYKDSRGNKTSQLLITASKKKDGGFVNFWWRNPNTGKESFKIAYAKAVPDWELFVASGVYMDDIEQKNKTSRAIIKAQIKSKFFFFIIIVFIALTLFLLLFNLLSNRLRNDFALLISFFDQATFSNKTIDIKKLEILEFARLSDSVNHMLRERSLAEEKIHESKNFLKMIIEESPFPMWISDKQGTLITINKSCRELLKITEQEVIGKYNILKDNMINEQGLLSLVESVYQNGNKVNFRILWAAERLQGIEFSDSKSVVLDVTITPIRDKKGNMINAIIQHIDITRLTRVETELRDSIEEIEQKVAERTRQLAEAQERAEDANSAKSTFLANMSHEIRTPMTAILGLTHLLQKTELNSSQIEQIKKISSAGKYLLSLINDILDLSKIEAGKIELEQINFNLMVVFDNIQSLFTQQFQEKGLYFKIEALDINSWLVGDPTRLRQALLNYLSNALKFTSSGKVILRVKQLLEQEGKLLLRFEVQDTGKGIDTDTLKQLFQSFEQADRSMTRLYGGTGLGLSITKHLANLMGGDAGAESEINQGSTFWFSAWFNIGQKDLSISSSLNDAELESTLRSHYAGARVLLVEDNAINREVAQGILADVNLLVDIATNGQEALEKVKTAHYALILMDVRMPKMDGIEATQCIRAIADNANLPILAMTAGVLDNEKQDCIMAGMNDFVAKPIDLKNLYSRLIKWLPRLSVPLDIPLEAVENTDESDLNIALTEQLKQIKELNTVTGLRNLRGDAEAYLRLLRLFKSSHGDDIEKLNCFLADNNRNSARQLAHTIKGAAGTLGITSVQEISRLLEDKLKSHTNTISDKEIARLLERLTTELISFHKALETIEDKVVSKPISEVNITETRVILEKLKEYLEADKTDANTLFSESEQQLLQAYGSPVKLLKQQIERFDYPEALASLKSLLESL